MTDAPPKQNDNAKPETGKGWLRIPVKRIWLHDQVEFAGGSLIGSIDCSPQVAPGRPFYVAYFVPAHQVIELEYYKNEKLEPHRTRLTLSTVKRFD